VREDKQAEIHGDLHNDNVTFTMDITYGFEATRLGFFSHYRYV